MTLGLLIFFLSCGHLFQLGLAQNINRVVYSCLELKSIGSQCRVNITKTVARKCAQLQISNKRELKPKRTRRKKKGGRRKRRYIKVCCNVFDRMQKTGCGVTNCVRETKNNVINKNNLISIDCRSIFQERVCDFRLGCINAQSCRNKTDSIQDLTQEMNIDLLCITESWLCKAGDEAILGSITPPGYIIKSYPRPNRRGGGIAFLFRNSGVSINVRNIPPVQHSSYEVAAVDIKVNRFSIQIVCIYRPPPSKKNAATTTLFLTEFRDLVHHLRQQKQPFIITGDFNFHYDLSSLRDTRILKSILDDHDLEQKVASATHRGGHILDLVIIPKDEQNIVNNVSVLDKGISDHHLLVIDLNASKPGRNQHTIKSRHMKTVDLPLIKADIQTSLASAAAISAESVNTILRDILETHAPLRTRTITQRPVSPWFCLEIKQAKQERRQAERKWRQTGLQVHKDMFLATIT